MSEDERELALFKYHNYIISEALEQGEREGNNEKIKFVELEFASLEQGLKKDGEYRVSISQAKRDFEGANLRLMYEKIEPTEIPEEWGGVFLHC